MYEHHSKTRDKLKASFNYKDTEGTLTMSISKTSNDDCINVMPS